MRYNIHGSKVNVTDTIKNYIEDKLGKLDKYFESPEDITATVQIKKSGIYDKVEVTIPIKKAILRAEDSNKDVFAAVDLVLDKLERQIRKNKTKLRKNEKEIGNNIFIDFEITIDEEKEESIVKRKEIEMKPMSEEEAILQMNLIDHNFFIFKNVNTNEISVVYKRNDNQYGIIDVK